MAARDADGGQMSPGVPELQLPDLLPPSRTLSQTELARREWIVRSLVSPIHDEFDSDDLYDDDEYEQEEDDDDEEVMERLRVARRRLEDLEVSERNGTGSCSPDLSPPDLRASSWGMYEHGTKPRSSSSIESSAAGVLQRRRVGNASNVSLPLMDLKLDLKSIPISSYIDAERRRIRIATERLGASDRWQVPTRTPQKGRSPVCERPPERREPSRSPSNTRPSALTTPQLSETEHSGSRFGLAPYAALEREEWRWSPEQHLKELQDEKNAPPALERGALHTPESEDRTFLSSAEAEWSWALSPLPPPCAPTNEPPIPPTLPTRV